MSKHLSLASDFELSIDKLLNTRVPYEELYHSGKVRRLVKIRNRYNQVPHLIQETTWESDKNTNITCKSQEVKSQATLSCDISPFIILTLLCIYFSANQKAVSLYAVFNYAVNSWEDLKVTATNRLYRTELQSVVSFTQSILA